MVLTEFNHLLQDLRFHIGEREFDVSTFLFVVICWNEKKQEENLSDSQESINLARQAMQPAARNAAINVKEEFGKRCEIEEYARTIHHALDEL